MIDWGVVFLVALVAIPLVAVLAAWRLGRKMEARYRAARDEYRRTGNEAAFRRAMQEIDEMVR